MGRLVNLFTLVQYCAVVLSLARLTHRFRWSLIALVAAVSVLCIVGPKPAYDDDVIRFLPADDPEIGRLKAIAKQFGSIHVALVGVETDGLFTHEHLDYLRRLHIALSEPWKLPLAPPNWLPRRVGSVTSLAQLTVAEPGTDPESGKPMTIQRRLVPHVIPTDTAALKTLQDGVMRLDYVVGALVSPDGSSARLILQLKEEDEHGERLSTKVSAEDIRHIAHSVEAPAGVRLHFGGAPFIAEEAANGSQRDLRRLAPWVALIIVLLIFISLGSVKAAALALGTVGIGILWTVGLIGLLGYPSTLVSTSLPVILVALGSAYAVHLLVWYLDHGDGVESMLANVGWPVIAAAATTVAGFISFLVMDLAPMREFGWQMAAGAGICALVAVVFIPAVLHIAPIRARKQLRFSKLMDDALVRMAETSRRHRWVVVGLLLGMGGLFGSQLGNIETRMDTGSFFEPGSPPHLADAFMTEHFGGAEHLQILVNADMHDPAVLRRVAAFEDHVTGVAGVTRVESITQVLAIVNQAVGIGRREVPETRGNAKYLGKLAYDSDKAVRLLVDEKWQGALVQVAIGGFDTGVVRRVTADIRSLAQAHLQGHVALVPRAELDQSALIHDAVERIRLLTGTETPAKQLERALSEKRASDQKKIVDTVRGVFDEEIVEEGMVALRAGTDLGSLAEAVAADVASGALSPQGFKKRLWAVASAKDLGKPDELTNGITYVYDIVSDTTKALVVEPLVRATLAELGDLDERVKQRVIAVVYELMRPLQPAPSADGGAPLTALVSGYPVVQEAMTQSVHRNQINSLLTSLPLVLLILIIMFRSVVAGLIGMLPTGLTLLVTFGIMGLMPERFPLDIGSSMLASIALGVGIDYAIHFLWRYRASGLEGAMRNTGRAIVINAAEITAGFVVLVGATIVPMSNFGLLTAETLLVAAVATLLMMPALVEWWRPAKGDR